MSTRTKVERQPSIDARAAAWAGAASVEVARIWVEATGPGLAEVPSCGLAAGDRPTADVELLAGAAAALEYQLAARMHAAAASGSLPLTGNGSPLAARGWSVPSARRLARAGSFAADHPAVAAPWAAGVITAEHVDAIVRHSDQLTPEELQAVLGELDAFWGIWSPAAVARFVRSASTMLHPPADDDPDPDEAAAYASRSLSFSVAGDTVLLAGALPRVEGELVMAAIDAFAERLRTEAEHTPATARRADALVELVNAAGAAGTLPSRGGLPVALTVTVEQTHYADALWTTSRGHQLTPSERRFATCDAAITPVLIEDSRCPNTPAELLAPDPASTSPTAERIAALAGLLSGPRIPLAAGRTTRTATPAQRRALAARDRGCVIPACAVPADACQAHHVVEWAEGGRTDCENMVLLCWAHHRQVDLKMWTIDPAGSADTPPGSWPANNGAPWIITQSPRTRWRM